MIPLSVLLVEDNQGDVDLIEELAKESEIPCLFHCACNGIEASTFLHEALISEDSYTLDLILLDLNIPCKDGYELLSEIKRNEDLKQLPLIVISSSNSEADIQKCYDLEVNAYVRKPVDLRHYRELVLGMLKFANALREQRDERQ